MTEPKTLPAGTRLSDYRIEHVLGSGGFGITYRARDVRLDTMVAVKEYFPALLAVRQGDMTVVSRAQPGGEAEGLYDWGLQKFRYEADSLAKLRHANIVGVNHLFRANQTCYMVLDFIDGQSMKDWLKEIGRPPTQDELYALLFPLLDALEAIHDAGLLHRDIAPKNIMLTEHMDPIVIDFGAVRLQIAHHTHTVANILTPGYAPAEQHANRGQGPWTDIYALAASFYDAIAGYPPPDGLKRLDVDTCAPTSNVARVSYDPHFMAMIDWGLGLRPSDRPQSIAPWRAEFLRQVGNSSTAVARPRTPWYRRGLLRRLGT